MVSQLTKTIIVLGVSFLIGYWYTNSQDTSNKNPVFYYSGKLEQVSLRQIDKIRWKSPVTMEKKLSAFVLGATGAVGKEIVKVLAADSRFSRVTLIGRRPVALNPDENPGHKKIDNQQIDFEKLDEYKEVFKGYDVGFSALGTTRSKSGADGFYRVDHDYVVQSAKLAKDGGCQHLHLVSTGAANKNSSFLYLKTKGQVEEELTEMEFPRLSIYRPGVLLLEENREDSRLTEKVLQCVMGPLDRKRWYSTDVPVLARVMVANCFREPTSKSELIENAIVNKFAKELDNGNVPPFAATTTSKSKGQDQNSPSS